MSITHYKVKELKQNVNKIRAFHIIYEGKPIGILTNQCDYSPTVNAHQDWRVFSLVNGRQHAPWAFDERLTVDQAIEQIEFIKPNDLIFDKDLADPQCLIKYYTAFGIIQYRGIDRMSDYPCFTGFGNKGDAMAKSLAIKVAGDINDDVMGSSMSFTGDRVIKIEVVILNTSEVVFTKEIEVKEERYKEERPGITLPG